MEPARAPTSVAGAERGGPAARNAYHSSPEKNQLIESVVDFRFEEAARFKVVDFRREREFQVLCGRQVQFYTKRLRQRQGCPPEKAVGELIGVNCSRRQTGSMPTAKAPLTDGADLRLGRDGSAAAVVAGSRDSQ